MRIAIDCTKTYIHFITLASSFLSRNATIELTCTVDSISSVTRVARAGETTLCVSAVCIHMAIVQAITLTLINVCKN